MAPFKASESLQDVRRNGDELHTVACTHVDLNAHEANQAVQICDAATLVDRSWPMSRELFGQLFRSSANTL